jgi:hypothetical protein
VLVEGESDRVALEALAEKNSRDLDAEGITVVPMNGAATAATYVELFGPNGFQLKLAGLYDEAEEAHFISGLQRAGLVSHSPTRADLESVGFFACVVDLENELIRALGLPSATQVIANAGDGSAFQTFQSQSPWNQRTPEEQILGFIKRRKVQYAPLLVDAVAPNTVPSPLAGVLAFV